MVKCPCCGYDTLPVRGRFETCFLCNWEDDGQDDHNADNVEGGPNLDYSLTEARDNFKKFYSIYRLNNPPHYFEEHKSEIELKKKNHKNIR